MKVYLAGPITGLDYKGTTEWREAVHAELSSLGILAYSPMRGKKFLSHVESFDKNCDGYGSKNALATNKGILTRDRWDATTCDVLLVNFLGAERVSIGTVMEIAWADSNRIPIVIAMEEDNIHQHGMIVEAAGYIVPTMDEALEIVEAILIPR